MKLKSIIVLIVTNVIVCSAILVFIFQYQIIEKIDIIEVNDICETLKENWDNLDDNLPGLNYDLDYVVLDINNQVILKTKSGLNETINSAISNRDTIVDIKADGQVIGKLIIYNNTSDAINQYKTNLLILSIAMVSVIGLLTIFYVILINNSILKPFGKLEIFAKHVAQGNLDFPLTMDKGNYFGAFTESFDLMRDELQIARENERKANESKKELVASLSHDIKTPVASIKAVSEIMQIKTNDSEIIKNLEVINSKADQINTLITNMFNATLEELQELKVNVTEESSQLIYDLIKKADYNHLVKIKDVDECIVKMDPLRLSQVIDNIISNSYKYANTSINVSTSIEEAYLIISFLDYGPGVNKEELPLIFNKFYRAKNSEGKSGTGLGLYIAKYLMNKMQGDITCENVNEGFKMVIKLRIA